MFAYSDPVGTGVLEQGRAVQTFRENVHAWYRQEARRANSAFTLLSAFDGLHTDPDTIQSPVEWVAFPKISTGADAEIDTHRFVHQDEYVEWNVERDNAGKVTKITFTTELYEGLEALAAVSEQALVQGIKDIIPTANPTTEELFGPGFAPTQATADSRGEQFVQHRRMNPWNNGDKAILCLGHRNSTMGALFSLVGDCAINKNVVPAQACAISSCVPGRNSDPSICAAVQNLSQSARILSLIDPVGIQIKGLRGIWKMNGQQMDINDATRNRGVWTISRNGRRAVLEVSDGFTMGDDDIVSGAQVSRALFVGATVISAPETIAPAWARTGQESSRMIL